jgi:hypothetical protein
VGVSAPQDRYTYPLFINPEESLYSVLPKFGKTDAIFETALAKILLGNWVVTGKFATIQSLEPIQYMLLLDVFGLGYPP